MTRSKIVALSLLAGLMLWSMGIILWPAALRDPKLEEGPDNPEVPRARLFEAPLTTGNFGVSGFRLFESREGKKYWMVRSQFAEFYKHADYTFMKEVEADFYSQTSGEVIRSRGDVGRSESQEKIVEMEGNVLIQTEQGYDFRMDKLVYDGREHEFRSDQWVRMEGTREDPSVFLEGLGLLGKIDSEVFSLNEKVSGKRRLSNRDWLRIQSDRGQFLAREKKAVFKGHVVSALPELKMESEQLQIELVKGQEVLVANGRVRLRHKNRIGHADKAVIDVGANEVDLIGTASVSSGGDKLQGSRILLFMDEDRVEVVGAKGRVKRGT